MSDPIDNPAGAVLQIDLQALMANWQTLDGLSGPAQCAAAVKADAYGCGLPQAGAALRKAGCTTFFVSQAPEGAELRPHVGDAVIYVLNGPLPGAMALYQQFDLRPVLNSIGDISLWKQRGTGAAGAVHIDTGMARLGLSPDEIDQLATDPSWADGLTLDLVMSHLVAADVPKAHSNAAQRQQFSTARNRLGLQNVPASLSNTSGIFLGADYQFDMVRPGIGLYGAGVSHLPANPLRQVVDLSTEIIQIRALETEQTIGYGGAYAVKRPSVIATVPVGYADGYPRALSHVGKAAIGGHIVPVVGRISMDLITLDVTDLPVPLAQVGQTVTLIGNDIGLDEMARAAGTVAYEVLTHLSHRIPREYRD